MNIKIKDSNRSSQYDFVYTFETGILQLNRIGNHMINKTFNIGKVHFPINLVDIEKIAKGFGFTYSLFECQQNAKSIDVRVVNNQRQIEGVPHIDLLMNSELTHTKLNTHLMLVTRFNALVNRDNTNESNYCRNCLNYFSTK